MVFGPGDQDSGGRDELNGQGGRTSVSSNCSDEWMRSRHLSVAHDHASVALVACGMEETIAGVATGLVGRFTAALKSSGWQSQLPPRVGSAQLNVCLPRKP